MADNKLELDIDDSGAKSKLAGLKAELAQLISQAQTLKSALNDATGNQRGMVQSALTGTMNRIGSIQSSLSTAQNSATVGGAPSAYSGSGGSGLGGGPGAPAGAPGGGIQGINPGLFAGNSAGGRAAAFNPYLPNLSGMNSAMAMAREANMSLAGGIGSAGLYFGISQLDIRTQTQLSGGSISNYQSSAGNAGRAVGGVLGGIAGSAFGQTAGGIVVGGLIGGSVMESMTARYTDKMNSNMVQSNLVGAMGYQNRWSTVQGWDLYTGYYGRTEVYPNTTASLAPGNRSSRFQNYAIQLNNQLGPAQDLYGTNARTLAEGWGSLSGGLMSGGINPFQNSQMSPARFGTYESWIAEAGRQLTHTSKHQGFGLIEGLVGLAGAQINYMAGKPMQEQLGETYMRRLATIYREPDTFKDVSKRMGPLMASLPGMGAGADGKGANIADLLGKFGPELTSDYLRIQNDQLKASVSAETLMNVTASTAGNARLAALGSLQPTGSGFAQSGAYRLQMQNLAQLPGGKDSLAYAQSYAGYRAARMEAFGQQSLAGFGLRDVALSGEQQRQSYMPFAPGNIFRTSLGIIANNQGQIGAIGGMLRNSDLSEQERYSLESQRQGLMTENARNVGLLSEGFENRLPALSAGRPAFFGRYNSMQGAAINLGLIGSPIRAYGAGNGRQAAMQADFVGTLGGGSVPGAQMPYSRTGELNTTNEILTRILQALQGGGGGRVGSGRPGDATGRQAGALDSKSLPDPARNPY